MLNVVNLIQAKTFKRNNINNIQRQNNISYSNVYNFTGKNLRPLAKDTVSFTSSPSKGTLNKAFISAFDNYDVCKEVEKKAKSAQEYLASILDEAFFDTDINGKKVPKPEFKKTIYSIETRVKTPSSIREKVADRLEDLITATPSRSFNPMDTEEIKANIKDIVGARIILTNSNSDSNKLIIDKIIELIQAGKLRIEKIENYEPEYDTPEYRYFELDDIERLRKASIKERRTRGIDKMLEYNSEPKRTGYMALHLDIDLSECGDKNLGENGYHGELQIIGYDVEKLKEVEDLCYKLKHNKGIKSGKLSFLPFVEHFNAYYKNDSEFKEAFNTYTRRAFQKQRARNDDPRVLNGEEYKFPTIEECDLEGVIPAGLDFNVLSKIKKHCDMIDKIIVEAQEKELEIQKRQKTTTQG